MKIYFPRAAAGEEGKIVDALLRNIEKIGDKWEVKISVPSLSVVQNLYLELTDEEMKMFSKELSDAIAVFIRKIDEYEVKIVELKLRISELEKKAEA